MSKIIAISMVKDENDIVGTTVRHMYDQVDHLLIADNMSSDDTYEILCLIEDFQPHWDDDVVDKMAVISDMERGYYQSDKMSALAEKAIARFGCQSGDWIVPFDADEMWMGVAGLRDLADEVDCVKFPGVDYRVTRSSQTLSGRNPVEYMTWHEPMNTGFEPKVAFRYREDARIDMGNHGVMYGPLRPNFIIQPEMYIGHFPIRSEKQFIRKVRNGAAAYAATDLPTPIGQHWRRWGEMTDKELRDEFYHNFYCDSPETSGLTFNPLLP